MEPEVLLPSRVFMERTPFQICVKKQHDAEVLFVVFVSLSVSVSLCVSLCLSLSLSLSLCLSLSPRASRSEGKAVDICCFEVVLRVKSECKSHSHDS